ncbi:hypothetical protein LAG90_15845 [Marinilongibacter aquaticus]|uniref:hypothetical protein n=1 Tax=Marinilongibacter aquaticus TaxID=2975157 RepID=UPI0021BDD23D|nr:hypothetical protein [Marinilongibacter aquaticus]UBM58277.1 hypothetical protein LAG90_15845 [Marinilongibacter aquaticus]
MDKQENAIRKIKYIDYFPNSIFDGPLKWPKENAKGRAKKENPAISDGISKVTSAGVKP